MSDYGSEAGAKGRKPMKNETAYVEDECGRTATGTRSAETAFTDIHHSRTSIGVAELPLNVPFAVEVTAVRE
jgi:hypothetical protein